MKPVFVGGVNVKCVPSFLYTLPSVFPTFDGTGGGDALSDWRGYAKPTGFPGKGRLGTGQGSHLATPLKPLPRSWVWPGIALHVTCDDACWQLPAHTFPLPAPLPGHPLWPTGTSLQSNATISTPKYEGSKGREEGEHQFGVWPIPEVLSWTNRNLRLEITVSGSNTLPHMIYHLIHCLHSCLHQFRCEMAQTGTPGKLGNGYAWEGSFFIQINI